MPELSSTTARLDSTMSLHILKVPSVGKVMASGSDLLLQKAGKEIPL